MKARSLRWTAGWGLAGIFHVALFWAVVFFNPPERKSASQADHHTAYEYVKAGSAVNSALVAEQIALFDPRPLLLPTKWNAGNADTIRDFIDDERDIFEDFQPQFRSGDGNFANSYGNRWNELESVLSAQVGFEASVLNAFGRKAEAPPSFAREGFETRVIDLSSGEELFSDRIYNNEARSTLVHGWPEWRPAQFLVSVADSFAVQEITVVSSSGSSGADELLRGVALSGILRRGLLEDGSYLVKIGL